MRSRAYVDSAIASLRRDPLANPELAFKQLGQVTDRTVVP